MSQPDECGCDRALRELERVQLEADERGIKMEIPFQSLVGLIRVTVAPRFKDCDDPTCQSCQKRRSHD